MTPEIEMTDQEARAVAEVFVDDIARGWIPKRADVEGALDAVRQAAKRLGA